MLNFYQLYEAIALQLQPLRNELANIILVRAIPSKEEVGTVTDTGSIYFLILSGKADPPNVINAIIQKTVLRLRVVVDVPALYGNRGANYLCQRVIQLLLGFRPPNVVKGLVLIEFNTYKTKNWIIEVDFAVETILKESLEEVIEPDLKLIIYLEGEGDDRVEFTRVESEIPEEA